MAKLKPESKKSGRRKPKRKSNHTNGTSSRTEKPEAPEALLLRASEYLYQLQIEKALSTAQRSLERYREDYEHDHTQACPALLLLGEIYLATGDVDSSRRYYLEATEVDPHGAKSGASPFLWVAQLSEEGGEDSIRWFEKASDILRAEIKNSEGRSDGTGVQEEVARARKQLGEALCSMAEVYMTDLSFNDDADNKCNTLITEALLVCPESPGVLQTLASVRISQLKVDDARSALTRSMDLWKDLPAEHAEFPDFAARISLIRLLLEVQMESVALDVVDQLVQEDDQSVEAIYLGAWARFLLHEKQKDMASESRDWFKRCLRLYKMSDYEDEKLEQHAREIMGKLDSILGKPADEGDADVDDDAEWEDEEGGVDPEDLEGDIEVEDETEDVNMDELTP